MQNPLFSQPQPPTPTLPHPPKNTTTTQARDGLSGAGSHNLYPLQYQRVAFDFFRTKDPDPFDAYAPPFVYYVRSGYTGTQAWVWNHWTGGWVAAVCGCF